MVRFCPKCRTERELTEFYCENEVDGALCGWRLSDVVPVPRGQGDPARAPEPSHLPPGDTQPAPASQDAGTGTDASPSPVPGDAGRRCPNGHAVEPGFVACLECGAEVGEASASPPPAEAGGEAAEGPTVIDGWELGRRLASTSRVQERFVATHREHGRRGVMTLYAGGSEPDPAVYDVLRRLPRDHVPEVLATGRWHDRAWEVGEELTETTLADLGVLTDDHAVLRRILSEVGGALHAFAEVGLRHRDLRPGAIVVRARDPLDLVVTGFGSARLSDFDLDLVSPLETTRYTAPEAALGGVAAASDWWSLGMVLLEQITRGACFEGVNEQAFLIHVLTNGAPIPEDLDPWFRLLLCGLLARERRERWGWAEVTRWLNGEVLPAPPSSGAVAPAAAGPTIQLAGRAQASPTAFALAAADPAAWDEARSLLVRGALATWAAEAGLDARSIAFLRQVAPYHELSEDVRLALALKALNPAMPLAWRGEIVTPGWLLDHPAEGYALVTGPAPDLLAELDAERWLAQLKARAAAVRERARFLDVELGEEELRVHVLSTSRSRLAAVWEERRRILPDTDHPALLALLERGQATEEDLILLLSAAPGQFRTADEILAEAAREAQAAGVPGFDRGAAAERLLRPRRDLFREVDARGAAFARCGVARVDEWMDRFRLERRLPVARALVVLAVPADAWRAPARQAYVATLLEFFARRVALSVQRGPLARMTIGRSTARVDLTELGTDRISADAILTDLLLRSDRLVTVDPAAFHGRETLEPRVRSLYAHATLYRRDTGIDGLYLGFPFLLLQDGRGLRPRIAPVLLWPVKLRPEVGAQGRVSLGFDRDREEVRLNPAMEALLGPEAAQRWRDARDRILDRETLTPAAVMDAFGTLATAEGRTLVPLPGKDVRVPVGEAHLAPAAVLFHLAYTGQAVAEDLRQLRGIPPAGSALETALRVADAPAAGETAPVSAADRYFTAASDPSQEAAVLRARQAPGLVVEGPPGTGKSQTIVNIVSDAIGRKRSLLIVCQKQAALDVVHKRLAAEGLAHRVAMVTDVNRDREPTVRAVREQLEALWERGTDGGGDWRRRREQAAARIEALEGELDRHHALLHRADPQTGLSYRALLGDLIRLEASRPAPVDAPALRPLLAPLPPAEVARLEEACGPLAPYWLPAEFEDSPLAALLPFAADAATAAELRAALEVLAAAEDARAALLARGEEAHEVADPAPVAAWLDTHAGPLGAMDGPARERLARWLPLLALDGGDDRAAALLASLGEVDAGLAATRGTEAAPKVRHLLITLPDAALAEWTAHAAALAAPAGFLARLNPARWMRWWAMRRFLAGHGVPEAMGDLSAFVSMAENEARRRPWRRRLGAAWAEVDPAASSVEHWPHAKLVELARSLSSQLAAAREAAARLRACPLPGAVRPAVATGTAEAFAGFVARARHGVARAQVRAASRAALEPLAAWASPAWLGERRAAVEGDGDGTAAVAALLRAMPTLEAYQRFRTRAGALEPAAVDAFRALRRAAPALSALAPGEVEAAVRATLAREARLGWKARMEAESPVLLLEAGETAAKVRALAAADEEMRAANREMLVQGIDPARLASRAEWEEITRLRGARMRRLREFIELGAERGLMELRPVWLMNPDVASRVLPLRAGLFDTVVYDEASQMPVEYALPSLFRARAVVVSGDEKQMPPTAFFSSRVENDEADVYEADEMEEGLTDEARAEVSETWDRREIKDCPDLLQLARSALPTATLQIHYRSAYRELIAYSNAAFYADALNVPARHPDDEVRRVRPVELVRADGTYAEQTNAREAEVVADTLAGLWAVPAGERKTVGVVTFNRKQADLIETVLEARAEADPAFRAALAAERERVEGGEDMAFFVKNVENVQGDERDVIVFSSTFGRNGQGTFRRNFGVLGQTGGERRLNVAVTRAREKVVLVTSMPIAEISDLLATRRAPASPRDYLQAYFEYARVLSEGDLPGGRALAGRLGAGRRDDGRGGEMRTDGFQDAVAAFLSSRGWTPVPVRDAGAFAVDFAIEDPRTGLYGIGIECDAPRHPLLAGARAREMWRPGILRRSLRCVHRVSSRAWYHEREAEQARLEAAVREALTGGGAA